MSMNKIFLIGNLTANPNMQTTPSGKNVCRFDIAVDRRMKNSKGEKVTDFWKIAVFQEKLGQICMQWLEKGKRVLVIGESQPYMYEKDNKTYLCNNVLADEIQFLSPKKEEKTVAEQFNSLDDLTDIDCPF